MRLILTIALIHSCALLFAQKTPADSSRLLEAVVIEAYETDRKLNEVPASVGLLKTEDLQRFNNTSVLPAVNILPGVRMEERSPGSYRFSIRGSSLRSPFGVRNVKVYWNGLPFTDGGGNTYLNLLDFSAVGSLEVIKGPGGSLYGAGTGGVLLIKSPQVTGNQIQAGTVVGSYGLQRYLLGAQMKNENVSANLQFAHHASDGYREQSALKRNAFNADVKFRAGQKGTLTSTLIFSNLFYETPGALNKAQYDANPEQARPPSNMPGAVEAKAAVTNETTFGGIVYDHDWNNQWATTLGLYGGYSAFENPAIRNYEVRDETNWGMRAHTIYRLFRSQSSIGGKLAFGGEYQYLKSPITVFDNDGQGNPGGVQVKDEVVSRSGLFFAQGDLEFPGGWFVTVGASINFLDYDFLRLEPLPAIAQERAFDAVVSPRLAALKKFSETISIFASYSDGFSPPSLAEVRPSTNTFSTSLKAESGSNLELGVRGNLVDGRLSYDVVLYDFRLRNTIVLRRDADEADYFVNAGKTSQRGLEGVVAYNFMDDSDATLLKIWASYAYQDYVFRDYAVVDEDFSGNKLTGIAPHTFSSGLDAAFLKKFSANFTLNYVDKIPVNDANSVYATGYLLVGLRAGWKTTFGQKHLLGIFAGADNLLDEKYSLGNDLNAFVAPGLNPVTAGRYYNAAMHRNFYAGLNIALRSRN